MKKTLFYITAASAILSLSSCAFFELDNYEAPSETLRGRVVDMDGNPVLTEQASEGIRVRFWDLTWEAQGHETLPVDFNCKPDGTFQNTKMFPGDYRVTVDGPFVPIVRDASDGTPIVNGAKEINIKEGEPCEIEFQVQPFLNVEFVGIPMVSEGVITAKVKVTRAISREDLNNTMAPTGNWNEDNANVTDIKLFIGYSSTMGNRNDDEYWTGTINFNGSEFDALEGQEIEITSLVEHPIPSGRHVFVRAAARINYQTANVQRYNYSDIMEVVIP